MLVHLALPKQTTSTGWALITKLKENAWVSIMAMKFGDLHIEAAKAYAFTRQWKAWNLKFRWLSTKLSILGK